MRKPLLLTLAGLATTVGLAGPAHADPDDATDAAFLASLKAAGLTYSGPDQVIATAKSVCSLMKAGSAAPQVLAELRTTNPGLTPERGAQFIGIAAQSYCPDQVLPHGGG